MQVRLIAVAAAALVVAGCAGQSAAKQQQPGQITVGDTTHPIDNISCSQVQWSLLITMTAKPAQAQAFLRLGADPTVQTVKITNFDGFSGIADTDVHLTANDGTYTITGTVDGNPPAHPDKRTTVPFRLEAPC